jgi:L-alanine-DL-glutamate epimerase-like enolase superfamily enzyme
VSADTGLVGWGEACPCGNNYLPNFPAGIRAGLDLLAPGLIGENPLHIQRVYARMDHLLAGHDYAKSAIGYRIQAFESSRRHGAASTVCDRKKSIQD